MGPQSAGDCKEGGKEPEEGSPGRETEKERERVRRRAHLGQHGDLFPVHHARLLDALPLALLVALGQLLRRLGLRSVGRRKRQRQRQHLAAIATATARTTARHERSQRSITTPQHPHTPPLGGHTCSTTTPQLAMFKGPPHLLHHHHAVAGAGQRLGHVVVADLGEARVRLRASCAQTRTSLLTAMPPVQPLHSGLCTLQACAPGTCQGGGSGRTQAGSSAERRATAPHLVALHEGEAQHVHAHVRVHLKHLPRAEGTAHMQRTLRAGQRLGKAPALRCPLAPHQAVSPDAADPPLFPSGLTS